MIAFSFKGHKETLLSGHDQGVELVSRSRSSSDISIDQFHDTKKQPQCCIKLKAVCSTPVSLTMRTIAGLLKWSLIAVYYFGKWNPLLALIFYIFNCCFENRYIRDLKLLIMIKCFVNVLSFFVTPMTLIFIIHTCNLLDDIHVPKDGDSKDIQSWEYGFCVWFFCIGIFDIFGYIIPGIKYYNIDYYNYDAWWKKIRQDRDKLKLKVLIPFNIDLRKIENIDTKIMNWHVVLAFLLPAIFIGNTLYFSFREKYVLDCGTSKYYRNHLNKEKLQLDGKSCILISTWDEWYIYYLLNAVSNTIAMWAVIKAIATFIIKYGTDTVNCKLCCGNNGKTAGGNIQFVDDFKQQKSIVHMLLLLRERIEQLRNNVNRNHTLDTEYNFDFKDNDNDRQFKELLKPLIQFYSLNDNETSNQLYYDELVV